MLEEKRREMEEDEEEGRKEGRKEKRKEGRKQWKEANEGSRRRKEGGLGKKRIAGSRGRKERRKERYCIQQFLTLSVVTALHA